jgi:hypothetical protein
MVSRQELTADMASYSWGFNKRMYPMSEEFLGTGPPIHVAATTVTGDAGHLRAWGIS